MLLTCVQSTAIEQVWFMADNEERPLVTFALFAYNQENYIREAVEGAFSQTYSPLEIILSDDCSTDQTFQIMQELSIGYRGPHRIILNKNPENLGKNGIGSHINRIIQMAKGELFVFAAGDDISAPNRTFEIVKAWIAAGKPTGSLHSAAIVFETDPKKGKIEHGLPDHSELTLRDFVLRGGRGLLGATHAITKNLFEIFGILPDQTFFEDRSLAFRSYLAGKIIYIPQALVAYRVHQANLTSGIKYSDEKYWSRWVNGLMTTYETFRVDYLTFLGIDAPDMKVIAEINRCLLQTRFMQLLISGSLWSRLVAAYYVSKEFTLGTRIKFILYKVFLPNQRP